MIKGKAKRPKVMLLVDGSPFLEHSGEIYLKSLCQSYPSEKICRFSLSDIDQKISTVKWLKSNAMIVPVVREKQFRRLPRWIGSGVGIIFRYYVWNYKIYNSTKKAIKFAQNEKVEKLWAVLNSPQMIFLTRALARRMKVPLVLTIWDPPERFAYHLNMDKYSIRRLIKNFHFIIKKADRTAVISEGMKEEYKKRLGVDCIVHPQGLIKGIKHTQYKRKANQKYLIIGFAGTMYSNLELQILFNVLDSIRWKLDGREVIFRFMGKWFSIESNTARNIEYLGWRSTQETIKILNTCDVLYLPYWFEKELALAAKLCFPSKIPIYLASGRPLLVHAPQYSSPVKFVRKNKIGLCCSSNERKNILGTLSRFIRNSKQYTDMINNESIILQNEFNYSLFIERFESLLGVGTNRSGIDS